MSTYQIIRNRQNVGYSNSKFRVIKNHPLFMSYIGKIMGFQDAIEVAKETFSQDQIWPDQCEYVIYKLNHLKKTANNIAKSIEKHSGKSSGRNHYPLLVSACYFANQVDIIIDSVRDYREVSSQRSARKSRQKMIITSLHSLNSSLHDLIKELDKVMANSKPL